MVYFDLPPADESGPIGPIFSQIYQRIKGAIISGSIAPGTKLPSSRILANQLCVARGTVRSAYDMLSGEGYVVSRGAAGTWVADKFLPQQGSMPASDSPTSLALMPGRSRSSLRLGIPALDAFPYKLWSRLIREVARSKAHLDSDAAPVAGFLPLRQAIANYLIVARGVACVPEQVFITAGFQGALGLLARVIMPPGTPVWFENPGYFRARDALVLAGAELIPIPVDQDGIDVAAGLIKAPNAQVALVTPSHQSPLGVPLSLARRHAMIEWATANSAWIIEDDYYSEFWYTKRQFPALKNLDHAERVFYAGTFSKLLLPSLRLGYVVVPRSQIRPVTRVADLLASGQPLIGQMALASFIDAGHFSRHIKRMRRLYADRQAAFAAALRKCFARHLKIDPQQSGMHLVARLPLGTDDVALAKRAEASGYELSPLSEWFYPEAGTPGLLLSFANVPVEKAYDEANQLKAALGW